MFRVNKFGNESVGKHQNNDFATLPPPEISGWIAWWAEQSGYDLAAKFPGRVKEVSPVWFMVDDNLNLSNVGKINRDQVIQELKATNVKILPSVGSELTGEKLSPLFRNQKKRDILVEALAGRIEKLGVDGVDVDLEGIIEDDRDAFTLFLSTLSSRLKKSGLVMSVSVHAQTGNTAWDGILGQDLARIGKIADEVRVMAYDEHSADSQAGPIASYDWLGNVVAYNLKLISSEKIVVGIPSYGYVWPKSGNPKGLQFDEFNNYLVGKNYSSVRNKNSGEMVYESKDFSAWLSDSDAMVAKIEKLRSLGINKFVIWHLGGLDERFFGKNR